MPDILLEEEKEDSRHYRFSLWWVEHRAGLKKIGIGIFIAFDVLLLAFVFWNLIDAYVLKFDQEQQAVSSLTVANQNELHTYTTANAAQPLGLGDTTVFSTATNQYDAYAELSNPNADWWAEFHYTFSDGTTSTPDRMGFILPNEQKPVIEFAFASTLSFSSPRLLVSNVQWHRVDHHQIPDYQTWSADRLNLDIQNPTFSSDTSVATHTLYRSTFTVKNNSAFSFYQPVFYLLLKQGDRVVGVNRTTLASLESGASQDVVVNWFGDVPTSGQIDVHPEINIFDPSVYKALTGVTPIDARVPSTP